MSSPAQRSLKHCRDKGYIVQVTERWQSFSRRRIDLYGFIDCLAIDKGFPLIGGQLVAIQTTSGANVSARVKKIKTECREAALAWLSTGAAIVVHGWRKIKVKRGGKAMRWALIEREITIGDLA